MATDATACSAKIPQYFGTPTALVRNNGSAAGSDKADNTAPRRCRGTAPPPARPARRRRRRPRSATSFERQKPKTHDCCTASALCPLALSRLRDCAATTWASTALIANQYCIFPAKCYQRQAAASRHIRQIYRGRPLREARDAPRLPRWLRRAMPSTIDCARMLRLQRPRPALVSTRI